MSFSQQIIPYTFIGIWLSLLQCIITRNAYFRHIDISIEK